MKSWLKKFFSKQPSVPTGYGQSWQDAIGNDLTAYPPTQMGIPVVRPQSILDKMQDEILFLKSELGLSYDDFDKYVLPVIINFIEYADLLPASEYKHHASTGGLIYHSFDCAKQAMRSAQHTQFPVGNGTLADTQQSVPQWKTGCVLAAFLHDGGKVLADVVVTNGDPNNEILWNAHGNETINQWSQRNGLSTYFVRWNAKRHQRHKNAALVVMQRLIPQQTWSWLDSCFDGKEIHSAMLAAVANSGIEHPLSNIVEEVDSASVKRDMFSRATQVSKDLTKVPLSELFADLIKHKIITKSWAINEKGAMVWYVNDVLYIGWTNCALELVEEINSAGYSAPKVPDVLARIMIEEGLALQNGEELYHEIYPEILGDKNKPVKLKCLKITNIQKVVLHPEKLYSLKEHPKKTAPAAVAESQPVPAKESKPVEPTDNSDLDNLFEGEEFALTSDGNEQTAHKQKMFESGLDTVSRVLGLMKAKLEPTQSQPEKEVVKPVDAEEPADSDDDDYADNEEYVDDYSDTDQPDDDHFTVQPEQSEHLAQEAEAEEVAAETDSVQVEQSEPISVPVPKSESKPKRNAGCALAEFIEREFGLEREDGKVQVPVEQVEAIAAALVENKLANEFNVDSLLRQSKEITVYE